MQIGRPGCPAGNPVERELPVIEQDGRASLAVGSSGGGAGRHALFEQV